MNWLLIGNTINTFCFLYALFLLPQLRPTEVKSALRQGSVCSLYASSNELLAENTALFEERPNESLTLRSFCRNFIDEFVAVWRTLTKPREGYKRACIWVCVGIFFIGNFADGEVYSTYF